MNKQLASKKLNISSLEEHNSRFEYSTPKLELHADFRVVTCGISTSLGLQDSPFNFEETL